MLTKFTRDSGYSETKDNSKDGQKLEIKTTYLQNLIATAGALLSSLSDRLIFTTISAESNLSAQSPCSNILYLQNYFYQNIRALIPPIPPLSG